MRKVDLTSCPEPEVLSQRRAAPEQELQERLFQEMRGRIKEDDSTVPEKEGDYYYYTRFEEGKQYLSTAANTCP